MQVLLQNAKERMRMVQWHNKAALKKLLTETMTGIDSTNRSRRSSSIVYDVVTGASFQPGSQGFSTKIARGEKSSGNEVVFLPPVMSDTC